MPAMPAMPAMRAADLDELLSLELLGSLTSPVESLRSEPLTSPGYSGASLSRLLLRHPNGGRTSLVLKRIQLWANWVAERSGDTVGREAALLGERALDNVWSVFSSPYRAYACQGGEVGLLMDDLADHLLPDVDEPLTLGQEDGLLSALANLHAAFWESDALDLPWLTSPPQLLGLLAPGPLLTNTANAQVAPVVELALRGWDLAFSVLPEAAAEVLRRPIGLVVAEHTDLPRTLLHGDAKVANFAFLPGGGIAAFDWALVGAGPCTMDLGWYLAVNASRLARPKEQVIDRYRELLEDALTVPLPDGLWERLVTFGVVTGARLLLWDKAPMNVGATEKRKEEWNWWVDRLTALAQP
jgi:hypothetical protein